MRHNSSIRFGWNFIYFQQNEPKFYMSSRKSEILHFDGFLLSKSYKISAKKLSLMTLKSDAKFEKKTHLWFHKWQQFGEFRPEHSKFSKLPHGFKYEMRNLMSFHPTTQTSENLFSMGSFCPKYTWFEQQKYRGVIFHDTEQWCKIWINPDLVVSQMAWGIGWTFIRAQKSLKNCTLMDSFCPKHIMFQLENSIGIMCHNTEGWCTI